MSSPLRLVTGESPSRPSTALVKIRCPVEDTGKYSVMPSTSPSAMAAAIQTIAYILLVLLLFGVATGLIGGL